MKAKYIKPLLTVAPHRFEDYPGNDIKDKTPCVNTSPYALDEIPAIIGLGGETRRTI
jgi:CheY-specific phosphatase CheX